MVGVEGTGSWGVGLSRFLHDHEGAVVEVDRPNRQTRRKVGKSDRTDAISAARAALSGSALVTPKRRNGPVEQMQVLLVARRSARQQRIHTLNQLRHVIFCAPEPIRSRFKDRYKTGLVSEVAKLRPRTGSDPITNTTLVTMRGLARRIQMLNDEIQVHDQQLTQHIQEDLEFRVQIPVDYGPQDHAALIFCPWVDGSSYLAGGWDSRGCSSAPSVPMECGNPRCRFLGQPMADQHEGHQHSSEVDGVGRHDRQWGTPDDRDLIFELPEDPLVFPTEPRPVLGIENACIVLAVDAVGPVGHSGHRDPPPVGIDDDRKGVSSAPDRSDGPSVPARQLDPLTAPEVGREPTAPPQPRQDVLVLTEFVDREPPPADPLHVGSPHHPIRGDGVGHRGGNILRHDRPPAENREPSIAPTYLGRLNRGRRLRLASRSHRIRHCSCARESGRSPALLSSLLALSRALSLSLSPLAENVSERPSTTRRRLIRPFQPRGSVAV